MLSSDVSRFCIVLALVLCSPAAQPVHALSSTSRGKNDSVAAPPFSLPSAFFDGIFFELFSPNAVVASDSHTYEFKSLLYLFHKKHLPDFVTYEWDSDQLVNHLTHYDEENFVEAMSPFTRDNLEETFIVNVELLAFLQQWPSFLKELNHVVRTRKESGLTTFIREKRLGKRLLICYRKATTIVAGDFSFWTLWTRRSS